MHPVWLLLTYLIIWMVSLLSWGTSIVVCLKRGEYLLLIAAAACPPVGVVHGIGVWMGVW